MVGVNAVAPGPFLTDRLIGRREIGREQVALSVSIGIGDPAEVAYVAVWYRSDETSFLTWAPLPVDRGRLSGIA